MFCAYAGSELRAEYTLHGKVVNAVLTLTLSLTLTLEYTLHGKVVNAAARMMSHAASKGNAPPLADTPRSGIAMTCRRHAPQDRPS